MTLSSNGFSQAGGGCSPAFFFSLWQTAQTSMNLFRISFLFLAFASTTIFAGCGSEENVVVTGETEMTAEEIAEEEAGVGAADMQDY